MTAADLVIGEEIQYTTEGLGGEWLIARVRDVNVTTGVVRTDAPEHNELRLADPGTLVHRRADDALTAARAKWAGRMAAEAGPEPTPAEAKGTEKTQAPKGAPAPADRVCATPGCGATLNGRNPAAQYCRTCAGLRDRACKTRYAASARGKASAHATYRRRMAKAGTSAAPPPEQPRPPDYPELHVCSRCGDYYRDGIDGTRLHRLCRKCDEARAKAELSRSPVGQAFEPVPSVPSVPPAPRAAAEVAAIAAPTPGWHPLPAAVAQLVAQADSLVFRVPGYRITVTREA